MLGINIHSRHTPLLFLEVFRSLRDAHLLTMGIPFAVVVCLFLFHRFAPKLPGYSLCSCRDDIGERHLSLGSAGRRHWPGARWFTSFGFAGFELERRGKTNSRFPLLFCHDRWQSAAISRAYASRHHQQLHENSDLVGLSAANAAAAFSGTFVVNGSPTQTSMVEISGGPTSWRTSPPLASLPWFCFS